MKKNNKGFTLIELLVVVAIIGILAAVGVVAYSGYTKGAKKSAVKSNQAAVIKYIAAELKKCEIGETDVMVKGSSKLVCSNRKSGTNVSTAVNGALGTEFKNPYRTSESAIQTSSISCSGTGEGQTAVVQSGTTITVSSCEVDGATLLSGTVTIE